MLSSIWRIIILRVRVRGRIIERENRDPAPHFVPNQYLLGHLGFIESLNRVSARYWPHGIHANGPVFRASNRVKCQS